MDPDLAGHLETAVRVARGGGRAALEHYGRDNAVEYKGDDSPLTLADRAAHACIVRELGEAAPGVPVLSEESPEAETAGRREWTTFWLVDPLDGTKEFLKGTGQFTVNIALVRGDAPVAGVVHVPADGTTYGAAAGAGAWVDRGAGREPIRTRKADLAHLTVVASRDHAGPEVEAFLARLEGAESTSMGSSLKFCLVAEGRADFYPRIVPTMEWDTAAAQSVVEAAGGRVTDLEGRPLRYNKEELRNPPLLAFGDDSIDWARVFSG